MLFYERADLKCSLKTIAIVTLVHFMVFFSWINLLAMTGVKRTESPMMVGLISQPSPISEMAKQPKVEPKRTNKIVKKPPTKQIKTIQNKATEHLESEMQATAEAKIADETNVAMVTLSNVESNQSDELISAKEDSESDLKSDPVYEEPKFGVAYLHNPPPEYPLSEKLAGNQGKVMLRVYVNEKGLPEDVQVNESSGYIKLDLSAVEAVKKWQFIPARLDGKALSAYVIVPVKFKLIKNS